MIEDAETYAIIGAAQKVHATLSYGFYERIYQDALEVEFRHQNIPYEREKAIDVYYRNTRLGNSYFVDFLCYDSVLVELKAIQRISKVEEAQVLHYLRASKKTRAVLLNFGGTHLEVRRYLNGVPLINKSFSKACDSTPTILRNPCNPCSFREGVVCQK